MGSVESGSSSHLRAVERVGAASYRRAVLRVGAVLPSAGQQKHLKFML
jgi:hypothetical protein